MSHRKLIVGLMIVSGSLSFFVGNAADHRRTTVDNNFCVLDKAIVTFMQKTMASVTAKDAAKDPRRWEIYRQQDVDFITAIYKISPCNIVLKIPPDPLS